MLNSGTLFYIKIFQKNKRREAMVKRLRNLANLHKTDRLR